MFGFAKEASLSHNVTNVVTFHTLWRHAIFFVTFQNHRSAKNGMQQIFWNNGIWCWTWNVLIVVKYKSFIINHCQISQWNGVGPTAGKQDVRQKHRSIALPIWESTKNVKSQEISLVNPQKLYPVDILPPRWLLGLRSFVMSFRQYTQPHVTQLPEVKHAREKR